MFEESREATEDLKFVIGDLYFPAGFSITN
jgi:hypothetical protein